MMTIKRNFNQIQNIFKPTGTSDLLINSIKKRLKLRGDVLDLGAGSGYIGIKLLKLFNNKFNLNASDIDKISVEFIDKIARKNKYLSFKD